MLPSIFMLRQAPERSDAKSDVRRILPVMSDRRVWIIHCRQAMHERRRTERRLARITEIDVCAEIVLEFLREAERKFVEEIVRMLPVVQRLIVPGFAGLKQKRITASAFGERIETHHKRDTELGVVAKRMGKHRHEPVRRVDSIVAASRADVGVTRKNRAMQHQHVVAEHEHAAVHRRRIRHPTCAGAFAAHRISEIDGGVHFHLHLARGRCIATGMGHMGLIVFGALRRWTFDACSRCYRVGVERFFSFIGTSFIPHFGQLPG